MAHTHQWWQTGVIYQIYPRSFLDSNGDGVGDLPGIASKLDYLRWLGVDAIWLSPIYPSPMADFGYDITNYTDVHPLFGTLQDLDILLEQTHQRDLKVILDFVPNHTSDEHPWFQETQSSRTNEKRDWYIWRDPAPDGGPPNNWISGFGVGSQQSFDQPNPACFVYQRQYADQRCLVALNFSAQDQIVTLPEQGQGRVLLSTHVDREGLIPLSEVHLRGNEGLLLEVEASSLPGE